MYALQWFNSTYAHIYISNGTYLNGRDTVYVYVCTIISTRMYVRMYVCMCIDIRIFMVNVNRATHACVGVYALYVHTYVRMEACRMHVIHATSA